MESEGRVASKDRNAVPTPSAKARAMRTTVPWAADHATWIFRVQEGPFGCGTASDAGTMGGSMCNIRLAGGMALPMGALNSTAGPAQVGWALASKSTATSRRDARCQPPFSAINERLFTDHPRHSFRMVYKPDANSSDAPF